MNLRFPHIAAIGAALMVITSVTANAIPALPAAARLHHGQPPAINTGALKGTGTGSRQIASSYYRGSSTGQLSRSDSSAYHYPSMTTNLPDQEIAFSWASSWQPSYKVDNSYTNGRLTQTETGFWQSAANAYVNGSKAIYVNNAAGFVTDEVDQDWDAGTASYKNNRHVTHTYNSANEETAYLSQIWNAATASWRNDYQYTVAYNAQGSLLNDLDQQWDTVSNSWQNYLRFNFTYDATGLHALSYQYDFWNAGAWENNYREFYTNDASGKPITTLSQQWNPNAGAWNNSERITNTYDAAGNITVVVYEQSNTPNTYVNTSEYLYTYNNDRQTTSITGLVWSGSAWVVGPYSYRDNYYYEPYTTTGIARTGADNLHLSLTPNPAHNKVNICYTTHERGQVAIVLTDALGRTIAQHTIGMNAGSNAYELSLDDVTPGMYFISLTTSQGRAAMRLRKD